MKCSECLRLFKRDGWYEVRQTGSHITMKHPKKDGTITIPFHPSKEIRKGTLISLLKKAQII